MEPPAQRSGDSALPDAPHADLALGSAPVGVVVAVCTYRRNGPLERLLDRLAAIAARNPEQIELGVVVADDNPSPIAAPVVARVADRFPLGAHHRHSGAQNISIARNLALGAACELAPLVALTDDDCVPDEDWIERLVGTWQRTGADAVSGRTHNLIPETAPSWISTQRVFELGEEQMADGAMIDAGSTSNCLLARTWLDAHPTHRFDPAFGRIGGEDMVFFRAAVELGMRSVHSEHAVVRQHEPLAELRLWRLARDRYWLGNSEAATNRHLGHAGGRRLLLRGGRRTVAAATAPLGRIVRGQPPHARVAFVRMAGGVGVMAGALGVRVLHR